MENSSQSQKRDHIVGMTAPSPWVRRFAPLVANGDPVLDVACGGGRHARHFLALGHAVTAIDRDTGAVADLADVAEIIEADLEGGADWPVAGRTFAGIVVTNYLYRPLFPHLLAAVAPGGVFIYETFATGNERYSRPRNPDHLLAPGELLERVGEGLQVVAYEHGIVPRTSCPGVVQRICAVNDHTAGAAAEPHALNYPEPDPNDGA